MLLVRRRQRHVQEIRLVLVLQLGRQSLLVSLIRHHLFLFHFCTRPTSRARRLPLVRPRETIQRIYSPCRWRVDERGVHFSMRREHWSWIRRSNVGICGVRLGSIRRFGRETMECFQRLKIRFMTVVACTDGFHRMFDGSDGDL
jgi:hypothetical protein